MPMALDDHSLDPMCERNEDPVFIGAHADAVRDAGQVIGRTG